MLINRKKVYSGKIVDLVVDTIEMNGRSFIREVVRHPGGVVVLAELPDGRIPFVRQLRYPLDKLLLELPAGKVDPGEDPLAGAARELEEETGYRPESLHPVFKLYPTPGYCDELLHFYYADRIVETKTNHEHDEQIEVEFYRLDEAIELCMKREIQDAKTVAALFWLYWRKCRPADPPSSFP
ncbi:MAG: NUDIX hydrolase [Acidobacteria bacterium]|nr:NUDIX hydrolase [Acidobacteriota bacterium]